MSLKTSVAVGFRRLKQFVTTWDRLILVAIAVASAAVTFASAATSIAWTYLYANDLQMTVVGVVDDPSPRSQIDPISYNVAIVNAGAAEAAVLEAEIVTVRHFNDGDFWVPISPPVGGRFEGKALKPGEIAIVPLVTDGYSGKYFADQNYARRIDDQYHEFVLGVRFKSLDSKGRIFVSLYPVSQFRIPKDYNGGPNAGFTFDSRTHQLLVNTGQPIPPLAKAYKDKLP